MGQNAVTIGQFGVSTNLDQLRAAKEAFERSGCAVIADLIPGALALTFSRLLDGAAFAPRVYSGATRQLAADSVAPEDHPVLHALHILMNDERVFRAVREITDCGPIGFFRGRLTRMVPSPSHFVDWHNDMSGTRMVGLTVHLSRAPVQGGVFRIRRRSSPDEVADVPVQKLGSAHLFRISSEYEHCVTGVLGDEARVVFVGWFHHGPASGMLQQQLEAALRGKKEPV